MQRNIIIALAVLVLLLAGALIFVMAGQQPRAAPIQMNAAEENVSEPYHQEMNCIDRLLQRNDLSANEVEPALARCQGGGGTGNQSVAQ